jgi:hypothetical protein
MTEGFRDDQALLPGEWIDTQPLNESVAEPESMGLPPRGAPADEVYRIADNLSRLRESVSLPQDGVYCPVCHRATVGLSRLRLPCPTCSRPLLRFGWD